MANIVELVIRGNDQTTRAITSSVQGLKGMESVVDSIGRSLAGLVSVGALANLARSAIQLGSDLDDASKKFGVSASELSKLQYVAKLSGVQFEDLGGAFKFMAKSIAEAENPTSDAAIAFKAMGISMSELKSLSPNEIFMRLADAFAGMEDGANKTALAMAIFGRSGANILPVLSEGAAGIARLKDEAKAMGVALSEDQIKKLDDYGDTIDKIGMAAKSTAGMLLVDLVDGIKGVWAEIEKHGPAIEAFYVRIFGGELSPGSRGIKQGKIADILVSNPDAQKKAAPNIEAIKKAAAEETKTREEGAKRILKLLGAQSEALASFYGDATELAKIAADEDIKGFEERQKLEADWMKIHAANVAKQGEIDHEALAAEMGIGGGPAAPFLFDDAMQAAQAYGNVSLAIQTMNSDLGATQTTLAENQSWIALYQQAWMDANLAIADSAASLYGGMQNWISSSLQGLITGTMAVMDVLKNLGKMMLSIITEYVAKWLVSRLFMAAMGKTFQAAEIAAAITTGTAVAAAWAPAAALVEIATLGSASVAAAAGLASTVALAQALAVPKLAEGGIVNRPTLALIGEKGPEAVVPLSGGGAGQSIILQLDGEVLAQWFHKAGRTGTLRLVPA